MNRDIKFVIVLFLVETALLIISYVNASNGQIPLTAVAHVCMGIITFWVASRLLFTKNKASEEARSFGWFFLLVSMFVMTFALPHIFLLFSKDQNMFSKIMDLGYIIGHIFLYLSLAVFIRVPLQWIFPRLKNAGSAFFLILGAITTALNIMRPGSPKFDYATGLTILNVNPLVGKLVAINAILAWVPAGIYLIVKGLKSRSKVVRIRALFIGIGLIVTIIGGPLHDVAKQTVHYLIADLVAVAGFSIVAIGVLYKAGLEQAIEAEKKI